MSERSSSVSSPSMVSSISFLNSADRSLTSLGTLLKSLLIGTSLARMTESCSSFVTTSI